MMGKLYSAMLLCAAFILGAAELPLLSPAPVIDGKRGDAGWKNALSAQFKTKDGNAFLGRSATHLYAAIDVKHGNIQALSNNCDKHDSPVYNDDCLDLFFSASPESEAYSQIIANVQGTIYDHAQDKDHRMDLSRDFGAVAKGSYDNDSYYIEIAVPLSAMGCCTHKLGIAIGAFTRWNRYGEAVWGEYHKPDTFTVFDIPESYPIKIKSCRWAYAGGMQSSFITLENTSSRNLLLTGDCNGSTISLKLNASAIQELECKSNLPPGKEGSNTLRLFEGEREILLVTRIFTPIRLLNALLLSDIIYDDDPVRLKVSVNENNAGPITVEYFPGKAVCSYKGESVEIPYKIIPSPWR